MLLCAFNEQKLNVAEKMPKIYYVICERSLKAKGVGGASVKNDNKKVFYPVFFNIFTSNIYTV